MRVDTVRSQATHRESRGAAVAAAFAALVLHAAPALSADAPDALNDSWKISLGMYAVDTTTDVSLDGRAGELGTKIDWDKTFGHGTQNRFRLDAQWRFAERHKLQAMWFNSSNSKTRTLDTEIDFGGETFPVDAKVKGSLDYDIYLLDYEYSFMRRETYELSASIGAYYADWQASLDGKWIDPNNTTQTVSQKGDASLGAPLPVLGLRGLWALPYDLSLDVAGQWFVVSVNQYSGNLQDYRATFTWQPKTWLGLGVGYDWFSAHGDVDDKDFHGSLDWAFNGLMIYYKASF